MIKAVELRKKGIKAIEEEINKNKEAVITYKGNPKFIVFSLNRKDVKDIDKIYIQALENIVKNKFKTIKNDNELEEHFKKLESVIK